MAGEASAAIPHLIGGPGSSVSFKVPPRTTFVQINGTSAQSAARYTISVSPDPLLGRPPSTSLSAYRGWPRIVNYMAMPLDPTQEYSVSLNVLEGDVGLQSILFINDDYNTVGNFTSTIDGAGANAIPSVSGGGTSTLGTVAAGGSNTEHLDLIQSRTTWRKMEHHTRAAVKQTLGRSLAAW